MVFKGCLNLHVINYGHFDSAFKTRSALKKIFPFINSAMLHISLRLIEIELIQVQEYMYTYKTLTVLGNI